MKLSVKILLKLYEKMLLVRKFEEKVFDLAKKGIVKGSIHLCIGEEAAAVGTVLPIKKDDYILPTHRGHGQMLAHGTNPNKMMAEIIGKENGLCKGRVGSMHIFDKKSNNLGAQGILGAQFPIGVGIGLAIKLKKMNNVLLCFFGDGTSNQGTFFESLNFADLWNLPIIFVCINNLYAMGTRYSDTCKIDIFKKAKIFNIEAKAVDGNDVKDTYTNMIEIVKKVRKEKRPALIECRTYRWLGHSAFDNRPYRSKKELEKWKKKDPIKKLQKDLLDNNLTMEEIEEIETRVEEKITKAEEYSLNGNYPVFYSFMEM